MKLRFALVVLVVLAPFAPAWGKDSPRPIPDRSLGLSRVGVTEIPAPPPVTPDDSAPGERKRLPRWNPVAPPMIPHGIGDFLPITLDSNACIDCHGAGEQEKGGPVPIPASHRTDLRAGARKAGDEVVGSRWICTACHASLARSEPLPASTRPAGSRRRR